MLKSKSYTELPYNFIIFTGRIIKAYMEVRGRENARNTTRFKGEMSYYGKNEENNYTIVAIYRVETESRLIRYKMKYEEDMLHTVFTEDSIKGFMEEYTKRVAIRLLRENLKQQGTQWEDTELKGLLSLEYRLKELPEYKWDWGTGINKRVEKIIKYIKDYAEEHNLGNTRELENRLIRTYKDGYLCL